MKLSYKFLLVASLLIVLIGCEANRYKKSTSSYYRGNYTVSIEELDTYLEEATNGAFKTNAELIRSKAYQQLALRAYNAENLALATRFALLANSTATDSLLARCYYDFANISFQDNDKKKGFEFYNQILLEIPDSRFVSEIIYTKMADNYQTNPDNYLEAWDYYKKLYPKFEDDYYEIESRKIVKAFSPKFINDALKAESEQGLALLLELIEYPVGNTEEAKKAIAQIYIKIAEKAIKENDFIKADNNYKSAVYYDLSVKDYVKQRLLDTAEQYIKQGEKYVQQRDFENAFILFNRTFDVIPGYKKALQAIQETTILVNNIERARSLFNDAQRLEKTNLRNIFPDVKIKLSVTERNEYEIKRFQKILSLYEEAYQLDPLTQYKQEVFYTENIIKYYKAPDAFAIQIIKDYQGFIVEEAINEAREYLLTNETSSALTDTGWQVLVSSGSYQYEVRYSLVSATNKFYFKWLVNLKTKEINAINSLSEQAMAGKFIITKEEENENID